MHDKCTGQMHDACQQRFVIAICDHNQMVLGALRVMYKSLIVHSCLGHGAICRFIGVFLLLRKYIQPRVALDATW